MYHRRDIALAGCCFGAGCALGWFPLQSTDLGHHLATGYYIWHTHALPLTDPFSWTARGQAWLLYQWVADLILAGIDARAGILGLVVVRALFTGALGVALYYATRARVRGPGVALAVVLVGLCLLPTRLLLRPMLVGYLGLAALDGLLARAVDRVHWRHGLGAVVLLSGWAALHPLFLLGCARWLFHLLQVWARGAPRRAQLWWAMVALATSLLVVEGVVPRGLEGLFSVIAAGRDPFFAALIVELQPFWRRYDVAAGHLLLVGLWAVALIGRGQSMAERIAKHGLVLLLFFGALNVARLAPSWIVLVVPLAALGFQYLWDGLAQWGMQRWIRRAVLVALPVVTLGSSLLAAPMGVGPARAENLYPRSVGAYLLAHPPRRLFHDLQFGGFLLWDLRDRVAPCIDGRLELYGTWFVRDWYRRIFSAGPGWSRALDAAGVDAILLSPQRARRLRAALAQSPTWSVTFADEFGIVYRRTNGVPPHGYDAHINRGPGQE